MSLPFDLEDVVGVAVAELIKRVLTLIAAIYCGWLQAMLALLITNYCYDFFPGSVSIGPFDNYYTLDDIGNNLVLGWLRPVISSWIVFYLVSLLGYLFYLFKSDCSLWRAFAMGSGIVGFFNLLAEKIFVSWWGVLALALWLMALGSVIFLSIIWGNKARLNAERHLLEVAIENEQKKAEREEEQRIKYSD